MLEIRAHMHFVSLCDLSVVVEVSMECMVVC